MPLPPYAATPQAAGRHPYGVAAPGPSSAPPGRRPLPGSIARAAQPADRPGPLRADRHPAATPRSL